MSEIYRPEFEGGETSDLRATQDALRELKDLLGDKIMELAKSSERDEPKAEDSQTSLGALRESFKRLMLINPENPSNQDLALIEGTLSQYPELASHHKRMAEIAEKKTKTLHNTEKTAETEEGANEWEQTPDYDEILKPINSQEIVDEIHADEERADRQLRIDYAIRDAEDELKKMGVTDIIVKYDSRGDCLRLQDVMDESIGYLILAIPPDVTEEHFRGMVRDCYKNMMAGKNYTKEKRKE